MGCFNKVRQAVIMRIGVLFAAATSGRGNGRVLAASRAMLLVLLATSSAHAAQGVTQATTQGATPVAFQSGDPARDAIQLMVERELGHKYRVEVRVGHLDSRLRLAPCGRVEPFLPPAARLWGRTNIGVRCVQGAHWSVLVPTTVTVFGPALVAVEPLRAGVEVRADDFRLEEVELSREYTPAVSDPEQLVGKVLTRSLNPGQVLRENALRRPPAVKAGDPVKILLTGQGFTVVGEGIAMNSAAEGERLRVRTPSGKTLVAPIRGGSIELAL